MDFTCLECSNEDEQVVFTTGLELMEHRKGGHLTRPKPVVAPPKVVKPITPSATEMKPSTPTTEAVKPIELVYRFIGNCPQCKGEVVTITVTGEEMDTKIAYCKNCDSQLQERRVIPLEKQKKDVKTK